MIHLPGLHHGGTELVLGNNPRKGARLELPLVAIVVIATALVFDFTNGFHDTANAMATPAVRGA